MSLIAHPGMCWEPYPWQDPELERLRRLVQRRQVEIEKERLREWLKRNGLPAAPTITFPTPLVPMPVTPLRPLPVTPVTPRAPQGVADVLEKIR